MLDYPPSCNRAWRTAKGRTYKPQVVIDWMKASATLARAAGIRPTEGPVHVSVTLHPRANKDGSASKIRIDLDNSLKVALDALQNVAFVNDNQVTRLSAEIGEPVKNGGLTVRIETI
jgi:crossover junction endodeoxyribonuclease RusA